MSINISAFLDSLNIMLSGMVSIFIVMLVIYGIIILMGKVFSPKKKKSK